MTLYDAEPNRPPVFMYVDMGELLNKNSTEDRTSLIILSPCPKYMAQFAEC